MWVGQCKILTSSSHPSVEAVTMATFPANFPVFAELEDILKAHLAAGNLVKMLLNIPTQ